MDETEARIAALELVAVEILADVDAGFLLAARDRIAEALGEAVDAREVAIRRQALQHIDDALVRYDEFTLGTLMCAPT